MLTPITEEAELLALFARAEAECWTELALVDAPSAEWRVRRLREAGWRMDHTFVLALEFSRPELLCRIPKTTTSLAIGDFGLGEIGALAIAAHLHGLRSLNLESNRIGDAGTRAIAEHLNTLTSLDLASNGIGEAGARAIAERLTALTSLNLERNQIGEVGARAIAEHLTGLTSLDLGANQIGEAGAWVIAQRLTAITSLGLWDNQIGDAGARAIAERLTALTSLGLWNNQIGDAGARAIAKHLTALTSLRLWNNLIGEVGARAIAEHLTGLTLLDLWRNRIGEVGARSIAEHLTALTSLDLGGNQIGEAAAVAVAERLTALTTLDLWSDQIGDSGALAIAEHLTGLTSLNLGRNQIGDVGTRAIADRLTGLTSLDLADNHIGDAGARAVAERLAALTSLNLSQNCIYEFAVGAAALRVLETLNLSRNGLSDFRVHPGALPQLRRLALAANRLTAAPESLPALSRLEWLDLAGNDLESLPQQLSRCRSLRWLFLRNNKRLALSPELFEDEHKQFPYASGKPNAPAILQWLARQAAGKRRLNEAKLLLVGQGGVGKTSLVRYIVDNLPRDRGEARTDGILIRTWDAVANSEHPDEKIRLNIWDFGGQEIMHATHQFFLTKRSLYLLVLDARKGEQEGNLHYWLGLIRGLGGDSPVVVVTNQCDAGNDLSLNESRLRLDYPNICGFVKTSCETGRGIDDLRCLIAHEVNGLPNAKEEWPEAWFLIKQELAQRAGDAHQVALAEYEQICVSHDVNSPDERVNVLRFLHDLGIVLYYADPQSAYDPRLRDRMILDPAWVTDGVYRIITSPALNESRGKLDIASLPDIMAASKTPYTYDERARQYIVGMMEKFELCFEYPHCEHRRFLVPERLDEHEPISLNWQRPDALRFQVSYSVLPGGIIPRLITRTSTMHADDPPPWRSGVVLNIEGCEAYVRGDREKDKRIFINVHGEDPSARRRALAIIRHQLREINATLPGIEVKELVPLPEEPDVTVGYEYLLELERDGDREFRPQGAKRRYAVRDLLEGVGRPEAPQQDPRAGEQPFDDTREPNAAPRMPRPAKCSEVEALAGKIDVAIITVRPDEFDAVLTRLKDSHPLTGGRNLYEFACVATPNGDANAVACRCPEQGTLKAATVARNLLDDLAPRWIALVGIAGGFPDTEFTLGDVLVASRLHDFCVTAALEGRLPELDIRGGPMHSDVQKLVAFLPAYTRRNTVWAEAATITVQRPQEELPTEIEDERLYGSHDWRKKVRNSLAHHFAGPNARIAPHAIPAPNAGADTLLKSATLADHWKQAARSVASVEMELPGVYEAVQADGHRCRLLGIRGISDIVGYQRNPAWTTYACHTAASFTHALIASGILHQILTSP